jgi:hypothetical protein
MKKLLILGIAAAMACAAYAYPTLGGPTGLVTVPTAAVAPAGQLDLAADWFYAGGGVSATLPLRVLYGIGDQFEIGASYINTEGDDTNPWSINAKYALPVNLVGADVALGATYTNTDSDFVDNFITVYAAATKELQDNLFGTLALQYDDETSDFALGLGAQTTLDSGLTLIGEYVNALPGASLSFAARYPFTEALTGQLGFVSDTESTFIGLNYAFDTAAK